MNYLQDVLNAVESRVFETDRHVHASEFRDNGALELRTIAVSMPRQFGATTSIAEIFNPDTDLYVALNTRLISDFSKLIGTKNYLYWTINSIYTDFLRDRTQTKNIKRVFIDASIVSMLDSKCTTHKLVYRSISKLDDFFQCSGNTNVLYVVT